MQPLAVAQPGEVPELEGVAADEQALADVERCLEPLGEATQEHLDLERLLGGLEEDPAGRGDARGRRQPREATNPVPEPHPCGGNAGSEEHPCQGPRFSVEAVEEVHRPGKPGHCGEGGQPTAGAHPPNLPGTDGEEDGRQDQPGQPGEVPVDDEVQEFLLAEVVEPYVDPASGLVAARPGVTAGEVEPVDGP